MAPKKSAKDVQNKSSVHNMIKLNEFKELLTTAMMALNTSRTLEYFGILAMGIPMICADSKEYEKVVPGSLAFTTGDKMVFAAEDKLNAKQLIGIIVHEMLHIVSDHIQRRNFREPGLWNVATDHVINRLILKLEKENKHPISMADGGVYFEKLDRDHPDASAEEIYNVLLKDMQQNTNKYISKMTCGSACNQTGEGDGEGDPQDGDSDGDGNGKPKFQYTEVTDSNGKKMYSSSSADDDGMTDDEKKKAKETTDTLLDVGRSLLGSMNKGNMPGELAQYLTEVYQVKIPWDTILEQSILFPVQGAKKRSWTEKNIYIRNVRIPGRIREMDVGSIVVGFDCSGSISDEDVKKFAGVVSSASNNFRKTYVYVHDTIIHETYEFERGVDEFTLKSILKITGRGGTSHKYVFDKVRELHEYDINISSVIFSTDFYSDVLEIYKNYEWMDYIPTVWAITGNDADFNTVMPELERTFVKI